MPRTPTPTPTRTRWRLTRDEIVSIPYSEGGSDVTVWPLYFGWALVRIRLF